VEEKKQRFCGCEIQVFHGGLPHSLHVPDRRLYNLSFTGTHCGLRRSCQAHHAEQVSVCNYLVVNSIASYGTCREGFAKTVADGASCYSLSSTT
jgi:hypothetical protein